MKGEDIRELKQEEKGLAGKWTGRGELSGTFTSPRDRAVAGFAVL
jgi:hypothetical protein